MVSHEEATAVDEEVAIAEDDEEQGMVVEDSSEGDASEAVSTTATKLYFGNLPYNCDSAQLAGIIQDYASPEMVEVRFTVSCTACCSFQMCAFILYI